jgi:hypothetical protein
MDRTRSGGLRGSMPSLMKHRHAPVGERRTCLLRRTIGAKVYGAIDDWLSTIRKPARAVTPKAKDVGDPMRGSWREAG